MPLPNIRYIPQMNNKKLKKYLCQKGDSSYVIEEDLVGWYLIVYKNDSSDRSSEDHLFDTFEDALFEAEDRFGIQKSNWKEIFAEN